MKRNFKVVFGAVYKRVLGTRVFKLIHAGSRELLMDRKPEPEEPFSAACKIIMQAKHNQPNQIDAAYRALEKMLISDSSLVNLMSRDKSLLMLAVEQRLGALVELLIRYGATVSAEYIVSCISLDYYPTLVAKLLTPNNLAEVGASIVGKTSERIRDTRFITLQATNDYMRHTFVKARAFFPYYLELRKYYSEQSAFLSLIASKKPSQTPTTEKCHAAALNSTRPGPVTIIFSFLRPKKEKYIKDAFAAVKQEPTAGLEHVIF